MAGISYGDPKISLVVGLTGGGKSLWSARFVWTWLTAKRRPVFTNMPLRWRPLRVVLRRRFGEEVAGLLHELRPGHFQRFMERYVSMRKFIEGVKAGDIEVREPEFLARMDEQGRLSLAARHALFLHRHGEHVTTGPEANWIPPTALILIDEVQHEFPNPHLQRGRGKYQEPAELQEYLTMHRHLWHEVVFVTQRPRQVSPTLKSLIHRVIECRNREDDQLIFGMYFKHVAWLVGLILRTRFTILGVHRWRPDQLSDLEQCKPNFGERPQEQYNIFPSMPWNRWLFSIYSSHTHAGSGRDLQREVRRELEAAGLDADGITPAERARMEAMAKRKQRKQWLPYRIVRWMIRKTLKLAFWCIVLAGVFWLGRGVGSEEDIQAAAGEEAVSKPAIDPRREQSRVTMIREGVVRFNDGSVLNTGGKYAGLECIGIYPQARGAVFRDHTDDSIWVWSLGQTAVRVGTEAAILERIRIAVQEDVAAGGASWPADAELPR